MSTHMANQPPTHAADRPATAAPKMRRDRCLNRHREARGYRLIPKLDRGSRKEPVMFVVEVRQHHDHIPFIRDLLTALTVCSHRTDNHVAVVHGLSSPMLSPRLWPRDAAKLRPKRWRKTKTETMARKLIDGGREERVPGTQLRRGDLVVCEADEVIPGDGEVIEGIASVDESAITGESVLSYGESRRRPQRGYRRQRRSCVGPNIAASLEPRAKPHRPDDSLVEGPSGRDSNEIALSILLSRHDHHLRIGPCDTRAVRRLRYTVGKAAGVLPLIRYLVR